MDGHVLALYLSREPSFAFEADILGVAGFSVSLNLLPPNTSCEVSSDVSEAVTVVHGKLGWIDASSELIERTPVAAPPGCVASMLVDCPEGVLRSGDEGAVFLKMRPSARAVCSQLDAYNTVPPFFPCVVREYQFAWEELHREGIDGRVNHGKSPFQQPPDMTHALHLTGELDLQGFRIYFEGDTRELHTGNHHLVSIGFKAMESGIQTPFSRYAQCLPELDDSEGSNRCAIRACLSSPGDDAALVYCADDPLDWTVSSPTPYQKSRARKLVIPKLHEHGAFWTLHKSEDENENDTSYVEYPWHSWSAGSNRSGSRQGETYVIWTEFEFSETPEDSGDTRGKGSSCIIC